MSPQLPTVLLRAQTDERLARLAALGSERAFEAIVERYRRPLLGYARRIAGESRAEDVVQAAFVAPGDASATAPRSATCAPGSSGSSTTARSTPLKRASASDVELFDDTPGPGDVHAEVERRDDVRRTLDGIAALGDDDVVRKIRTDFDAKNIALSDHQIRRTMEELLVKAAEQIQAEKS